MSSTSPNAWVVWLVIALMLATCIGIIIWFAIDNNIPGKIGSNQSIPITRTDSNYEMGQSPIHSRISDSNYEMGQSPIHSRISDSTIIVQ